MLNHIDLMGRLTADPEPRETAAGTHVVNFTLASDTGRKDARGDPITYFVRCVAWRGTADLICRYLTKGRLVVVEGSLETRSYDDNTGTRRFIAEVNVRSVHFTDSNRDRDSGGAAAPPPDPGEDEDLPF
jgi:single-strand DNA-binding protein